MTIGKTRPAARTALREVRGVLHRLPVGEFAHGRVAPPPDLADRIEHFWSVRWNLEGLPPQVQQTLPHPSVHLVIEPGRADFWGVHTGCWTRELSGRSAAFGVKFRPGGFRGWFGQPLKTLANRSLPAGDLLGADARSMADVLDGRSDDEAADLASTLLRAHLPPAGDAALLAGRIADAAADDLTIRAAQQLADRFGRTLRALQRLFNDQVGVGPKWVINRYRIHEAVARVQAGEPVSWADLAHDLGYFDQAHFIADFRRLTGRTPVSYARSHHAAAGGR
ncbi:MAG: AraC family transcriptional regulator [Burkholderiales bacterium]|nr:MAG: AraC family transcriptional regulator [Burkholderiales bacterium]